MTDYSKPARIIFRQVGNVTWASPDGSEEKTINVYPNYEERNVIVCNNVATPGDWLIEDAETGWTLVIPKEAVSVIRDEESQPDAMPDRPIPPFDPS